MRIRTIKPEFWRSDDIDALDWHARLVFIGLWSYVDDNGVGRDRESDIAADLFSADLSRDPRETLARVADALEHLSKGGQISRYTVAGRGYLHVTSWEVHQKIDRPAKPRYPLPTSKDAIPRDTLATPSRDLRDSLDAGTGEQRNRGIKNIPPSAAADEGQADLFEEFWKHYPRKIEKQDARKAWRAALKKTDAATLIAAVQTYPFGTDRQFIKHAATWLNKGCWADTPDNVRPIHPDTDRRFDADELTNILGPDRWTCPPPPPGLTADQDWEWRRQQQLAHIEDRQRQARERAGVRA